MKAFIVNKQVLRFIVLQRIELLSPFLAKMRKLFGRYLFTNFITKYFLSQKLISQDYYRIMHNEYLTIKDHINEDDNLFLSIGSGIGGLESIMNERLNKISFYLIERNFVSQKVKYGWGDMNNKEAYNNFELQKLFLEMNGMSEDNFYLFDYDKDKFPIMKFDIITSLFSLDYHYDFNLYIDYLKKVSTENTKIIFDTIRAKYFRKVFRNVKIINSDFNTIHKSKRIVCSHFLK